MLGEPLFEDNHLLIVNKPPGLLTQPSGTDQDSLEASWKQWIKEKYHKPGNVFLEAIHRLDKPVSGIVVFAKTSKALSRLNQAERKKVYTALLEKEPDPKEGTLKHHLVHDDFHARVDPSGKLAVLHYKVIGTKRVEIELETGRYHQIRAQFAAIGCPIVGDKRYGSPTVVAGGGIYLHHSLVELQHPVTGEKLTVVSEPQF